MVKYSPGRPQLGANVRALGGTINGDGAVINTGTWFYIPVPWDCVIFQSELSVAPTGSSATVTVDWWFSTTYPPADANSITASDQPSISAGDEVESKTTFTGWTLALTEGGWLALNIDSIDTATVVNAVLLVEL